MTKIDSYEKLIERLEELKKKGEVDLSLDEDLALGIMNLIAIEEHLFFTGCKTEKDEYWNILMEVRQIRKKCMEKLLPNHEGETWCTSKHLLSASMRLMEVGTKLQTSGDKVGSEEYFKRSFDVFNIFWVVKLRLSKLDKLAQIIPDTDEGRLKFIMNGIVNCCNKE